MPTFKRQRAVQVAVACTALVVTGAVLSPPAQAATPALPGKIVSITARPGPKVGQITFTWKQNGKHTTGFRLETALTTFSRTNPAMLKYGRGDKYTAIARNRRSITLSASQVWHLGAGVSTGNALFFRFAALDKRKGGTTVRNYPYLQAVLPKAQAPKAAGTAIEVASFNIRTAKETGDKQSWLERAPEVASAIVTQHPGIVAVQELGPGRADGKAGANNGAARQTGTLESALRADTAPQYQLVRTTPYVPAGQLTGSEGARILYDTTRYTLLSNCPDTTDGHPYSSSCTIQLPLLPADGEQLRRKAAIAEFQDRATGRKFWFVSAHLDERHSSDPATERGFDTLRGNQAEAITAGVDKANTAGLPVIIAGDFNSWQNNRIGNAPHDYLVTHGYYDTSAAVTRVNFQYPTFNAFRATLPAAAQGIGVRIDMIFVKGARGSARFENVMKVTDPDRPSDHNMILADLVL